MPGNSQFTYCSIFLLNNLLFCLIFFTPVVPACVRFVLRFTGDTVLFRGPFPQVDQPASLGAERPERIPVPGCFFLAYRASMFLCFVFHGSAIGRQLVVDNLSSMVGSR